jgi:hypothetical protein
MLDACRAAVIGGVAAVGSKTELKPKSLESFVGAAGGWGRRGNSSLPFHAPGGFLPPRLSADTPSASRIVAMGCYPKPLTTAEADALIAPVLILILADASPIGLPHMGRAFVSDNREIAQRRAFASGDPGVRK